MYSEKERESTAASSAVQGEILQSRIITREGMVPVVDGGWRMATSKKRERREGT